MNTTGRIPFPTFMDIPARIPGWIWYLLRILVLGITSFMVWLLARQPELGLTVFWKLLIPLLPLVFAIAPGLWRNVCPMAFLNQLPRQLNFSLGRDLGDAGRKFALVFSFAVFLGLVTLRPPLLNHSGLAVTIMAVSALTLAFVGGLLFKGRSGWCGTFCPLGPIQKVYGQAPLMLVRNSYCDPCVGCQRNCYDFNPRAAVFSDLYDQDRWWSDKRRYFPAALPGLIVGFFQAAQPGDVGMGAYYLDVLLPPIISIGIFQTLDNFVRLSTYMLVALFGMVALGTFYWFAVPLIASGLLEVFQLAMPQHIVWGLQGLVVLVCLMVIARGLRSEQDYVDSQSNKIANVGRGMAALQEAARKHHSSAVTEQASGKCFDVASDQTLLEAIEAAELPIMSGCRMGVCGADPVVIVDGEDALEPPHEEELATLKRLGLEGKARLACCCKVTGEVTIDLDADPEQVEAPTQPAEETKPEPADENRRRVVIVGNGIAGISSAEQTRQVDEHCRIDLITQETHPFYNRMGLGKVVYGRTGMEGLYLIKEDWYQRNKIEVWLNTQVTAIDRDNKQIQLGTGESLPYDTLILATGARAFMPPVAGFDLPGCFALREAKDALEIRSWVQTHRCKHAVVLGGGVLGVEAADALRQIGLKATIVQRSDRLMDRQLDQQGAELLEQFCQGIGIEVRTNSGVDAASGTDRIEQVKLADGVLLPTDVFLVCAGIRANTDLAREAGLEVNRGVVVDAQMRTSDPDIYCVGDCAELPGAIGGLWAVGNNQGKVAASNSKTGSDEKPRVATYEAAAVPPVQLKMGGIDLKSFGRVLPGDGDELIEREDAAEHCWQTLVLSDGKIAGGVFINAGGYASAAIAAQQAGREFDADQINALAGGDWSVLRG